MMNSISAFSTFGLPDQYCDGDTMWLKDVRPAVQAHNCRNCGARPHAVACDYCGTPSEIAAKPYNHARKQIPFVYDRTLIDSKDMAAAMQPGSVLMLRNFPPEPTLLQCLIAGASNALAGWVR